MTTVTRRYRFSASHRLHAPELTAVENARLYGKCNNPYGHGHDYVLEVTAAGEVEPETGRLLSISKLDRLVHEVILERFANRNINLDVPEFKSLVPTTENIASVIAELIRLHWEVYLGGSHARLSRVHVQETNRNGFEVLLNEKSSLRQPHTESESVNA